MLSNYFNTTLLVFGEKKSDSQPRCNFVNLKGFIQTESQSFSNKKGNYDSSL